MVAQMENQTPQEAVKIRAETIRKSMTGEHYYDKEYGNLTVADLLLVLEDDNWHTQETLVEALVAQAYYSMIDLCKAILIADEVGHMPPEIYEHVREIDLELRKENTKTERNK